MRKILLDRKLAAWCNLSYHCSVYAFDSCSYILFTFFANVLRDVHVLWCTSLSFSVGYCSTAFAIRLYLIEWFFELFFSRCFIKNIIYSLGWINFCWFCFSLLFALFLYLCLARCTFALLMLSLLLLLLSLWRCRCREFCEKFSTSVSFNFVIFVFVIFHFHIVFWLLFAIIVLHLLWCCTCLRFFFIFRSERSFAQCHWNCEIWYSVHTDHWLFYWKLITETRHITTKNWTKKLSKKSVEF